MGAVDQVTTEIHFFFLFVSVDFRSCVQQSVFWTPVVRSESNVFRNYGKLLIFESRWRGLSAT